MNNLLSYCGLVDAKIRASDKDLPVMDSEKSVKMYKFFSQSSFWLVYCKRNQPKLQIEFHDPGDK